LIGEDGDVPQDVETVDDDDPIYQFCSPPKGAYPRGDALVEGLVWNRFSGKLSGAVPLQLLVVRHGRDAVSK
jgi:hypothetical protein